MLPFLKYRAAGIIAGLVFILSLVSGCGRQDENVLARAGGIAITTDGYMEEFAKLPPRYKDIANLHKEEFLESLINKHLLLEEAKRKKLQNSEIVNKLVQDAKEEIMIQELIEREVNGKVELSDGEAENYYRENLNNYTEPVTIRASHILVDSEVVAVKILDDLERGLDFAELAEQYSLDIPTKDRGGDVGYFSKGEFFPGFERACEKMESGETSGVVKTELGYHIIKVMDKKEARHKTFEEVKDVIENELFLDKQMQLYEDLLQRLRKDRKVIINKDLLEATHPLSAAAPF